eukprot:5505370-Amphidinium_carterae.1
MVATAVSTAKVQGMPAEPHVVWPQQAAIWRRTLNWPTWTAVALVTPASSRHTMLALILPIPETPNR